VSAPALPVAVDVVTGFLGAGKTTLLRYVLAHGLAGARVAVIVNEIGDVAIDGRVVTGLGAVERMVELSSGCICCSIDDYRFDQAIQEIVATVRPDLIVIETSGLADPDPLAYRVGAAGLRLDAIVTLVDAAHVERALAESEVAARQIAAADFVVLNKPDLVAATALDRVEYRIGKLNPRALRWRTMHGALDADLVFATGAARWRAAARTSGHLARDGFAALSWHGAAPLEQGAFERMLEHLPESVVRAKGLVQIAGREWHRLFNVTCGRVDLGWLRLPPGERTSQAVFIGKDMARHEASLRAALADCERPDEAAVDP
jgi:G3E family GTPase